MIVITNRTTHPDIIPETIPAELTEAEPWAYISLHGNIQA